MRNKAQTIAHELSKADRATLAFIEMGIKPTYPTPAERRESLARLRDHALVDENNALTPEGDAVFFAALDAGLTC